MTFSISFFLSLFLSLSHSFLFLSLTLSLSFYLYLSPFCKLSPTTLQPYIVSKLTGHSRSSVSLPGHLQSGSGLKIAYPTLRLGLSQKRRRTSLPGCRHAIIMRNILCLDNCMGTVLKKMFFDAFKVDIVLT